MYKVLYWCLTYAFQIYDENWFCSTQYMLYIINYSLCFFSRLRDNKPFYYQNSPLLSILTSDNLRIITLTYDEKPNT